MKILAFKKSRNDRLFYLMSNRWHLLSVCYVLGYLHFNKETEAVRNIINPLNFKNTDTTTINYILLIVLIR